MHTLATRIDNLSSDAFTGLKWLLTGLAGLAAFGFVVALEAG